MKRIIALLVCVVLVITSLLSTCFASVTRDQLDSIPEASYPSLERAIDAAIEDKQAGRDVSHYSYMLKCELSDLSLSELKEIKEYINGDKYSVESESQIDWAKALLEKAGNSEALADIQKKNDEVKDAFIQELDPDVYSERFTSQSIAFPVYKTISKVCRSLDYAVQNNNPEIEMDEKRQKASVIRIYITYFANCTKESARIKLEDYSSKILSVLQYCFPNLDIDAVWLCWQVPSINEVSLYAATYWCESDGEKLVMGEGKGMVYEDDKNSASASPEQNSSEALFSVPPGEYIVGEDIPAGTYRLEIANPSKSATILVNEPGEYGGTILCETLGKYGGTDIVGKTQFKSGYLVYIGSSAIDFYEYEGILINKN